jgi:hypothetical protein
MEKQINNYFSEVFREARLLLMANNTADIVPDLENKAATLSVIYDSHKKIVDLIEGLRHECKNKADEILEEIELKQSYDNKSGDKFPFIFQGKNKNMSWGDMADIEDRRINMIANSASVEETLVKEEPSPEKNMYKKLNSINGVNLPKEIRVKLIPHLDDLEPALGWYPGDRNHKEGIYIRLPENLFIRIPFPDVIDGTQNFNRSKTIKCKYESLEQCEENRQYLSGKFNTDVRECLFAHKGDNYSKVGTNFHCPSNPRFGNHAHLKEDIENLKVDGIKPVLMYALSDILMCYLWNDYHHANDRIVFNSVEICQ